MVVGEGEVVSVNAKLLWVLLIRQVSVNRFFIGELHILHSLHPHGYRRPHQRIFPVQLTAPIKENDK